MCDESPIADESDSGSRRVQAEAKEQPGERFLSHVAPLHSGGGSDMAIFCLLCGKRFQTQTALQQHMEVHAGVRSYICSECNRTFPSHTALKRHLRSHTAGDHPYECEFCGSCFRDESTLKGHKRIHTGEKPYECNGCGKKFSLKHQLETHYRVHTVTSRIRYSRWFVLSNTFALNSITAGGPRHPKVSQRCRLRSGRLQRRSQREKSYSGGQSLKDVGISRLSETQHQNRRGTTQPQVFDERRRVPRRCRGDGMSKQPGGGGDGITDWTR
ncbi:hypothetical protein F2P81_025001 [Scophthalmus maximus]|uniref:C2H2-type domain-containing protein n=1 Tax=Scophthalmus maximus TaxID=52904 RepID=A0A6A4RUH9_SCOMX|nr:hypothetical protein F2P81_025001 [Scophthalmus maximus]